MERAGLPHKAANHKCGGNTLGDDGGKSHASHIHVQHDDEEQVQRYIDDAGEGQIVQGTAGVACGPQQRRAEVIQPGGRHAQEIDPQVQNGQGQHVRRRLHQPQDGRCAQHADEGQSCAADEAQQNGGVDGPVDLVVLPGAEVPGGQNAGAGGQTHEQVHQQVDQGGGGAHGSQRVVTGEAAHHDDVRRVEQQLQQTGADERQGEAQHFGQDGPGTHIDGIGFLRHARPPFAHCLRLTPL